MTETICKCAEIAAQASDKDITIWQLLPVFGIVAIIILIEFITLPRD